MMSFFHTVIPFVEIMALAIMNQLPSFILLEYEIDGSRPSVFFAFLLILAISSWLNLPVLHKILVLIGNVAAIAVIVIFQPELRMALSKLSLKSRRYREVTEFDKLLDQLANSIYRMSEKRIGALVALENEDSLDEYAQKAVLVNGEFSAELLETIFLRTLPFTTALLSFAIRPY